MYMKTMKTFGLLLLGVAVLAGCKQKEGSAEDEGNALTLEYFAFQEEEDGPWGLMATDGTVLVKPKFNGYMSCVVNDRFYVQEDDVYTIYTADERPKKIGTYKECGSFVSDLCPVQDMNDNIFYIDKDGKKAFDLTEIDGKTVTGAFNFFCGRAMVCLDGTTWGYIDENGETAIPFKFADAWNFNDDVAIVYIDNPTYEEGDMGKWAVIDTDGNKLFTKRFSDVKPSEFRYADGLLEVTDANDNYMLIDKNGNVVQKMKEGCFTNYIHDGIFTVYNNQTEKTGLMDKEGEWIIRPKFQAMSFNGSLLVCAEEDEQYSLYNMDGEKIAKLPHGYVNLFEKEFKDSDSYLLVGSWEDGYQLVDSEGNVVDTDYAIHGYNTGYSWGFMISTGDEEYYEEEYDEDYEEADSIM